MYHDCDKNEIDNGNNDMQIKDDIFDFCYYLEYEIPLDCNRFANYDNMLYYLD